jgi:glycosyltransferase involved in cell wall biosynthesis
MHIGLNAHLLSGKAGYRSAGIHGYIEQLLRHLPEAAPPDWRFTALVGAGNNIQFEGVRKLRSLMDTEAPLRRIFWEQIVQPWELGEYDLYHALAFVAPLWLRKPSVVTVYDLSFMHYPEVLSPPRRLYLRLFTGITCRRAQRVIAISQSTARDIAQTLDIPMDKIDIAAPGYDREVFRPLRADEAEAFRRKQRLPERFWLFVGTLEPRKNLLTLLQAYAALSPHERLPLIIGGGKGWDYEPIFEMVERHKLNVEFTGFIASEELPFWYNCAEAFLFPSVFEGFGLPVLEAMACGTPVIVSDASSLPEVVGEAGSRISPHDVEAWTAALQRAAGDREWRQLARERGLEEAQRYVWTETANQTIHSYRSALK